MFLASILFLIIALSSPCGAAAAGQSDISTVGAGLYPWDSSSFSPKVGLLAESRGLGFFPSGCLTFGMDMSSASDSQWLMDLRSLQLIGDSQTCFKVCGNADRGEVGDFGLCSRDLTASWRIGLSSTAMVDMYSKYKDMTFGPMVGAFVQYKGLVIQGYAVSGFAEDFSDKVATGISLSCRF